MSELKYEATKSHDWKVYPVEQSIFEEEIAKYERRLDAIERNPRPDMNASNKILYQLMLEENRALDRAWREGKTFLAVVGHQSNVMRCFGDYPIVTLTRIADRLGLKRAEAAAEKVRAMGWPDYSCDRCILLMPLAYMGEELPKPKLIVAETGGCNVHHDCHEALAAMLDIPFFTVDIPFKDPPKDHLDYVVKQVDELIEFVEANLPGAKFNMNTLIERGKIATRRTKALHEINELRMHIPCPDHPRDVFREPLYVGNFIDPTLLAVYYEAYRDELKEKVARGYTPVGEEKLRLVWSISGPHDSSIWDYLVKRGVSLPYWHQGGSPRAYVLPFTGDQTEFGRRLTPMEEEIRTWTRMSWGGTAERWLNDIIPCCKESHADGLVMFEEQGCQPMIGMCKLTADLVEKELGIPVWRVEGRQLLGHTERENAEFLAGLEAFVNLCFERKGRK